MTGRKGGKTYKQKKKEDFGFHSDCRKVESIIFSRLFLNFDIKTSKNVPFS